ncbi:uncharacterized protein LOC131302010 isoform X2 [Rhododendron vialii]|uniref:uncharacterized protein LOC131302010 isoform X2 n=1 Tax=Rhododendron vialii TaxID=182163 RepID=UPI00265FB83A|nr:uncharacterized protein LOC131302010 isoform X2 [Rhododendron vialii]
METVSDCRTATRDTIGNTTKHMASLSLDQFVQMDESGKIEVECDTGMLPDDQGCETHNEAEDKKEDTMPTAPNDPFKNITVYPPGVDVPPHVFDFVEEIRRPSPREMMFHYTFLQKMKKEREDRIMTTMGRGCRTCTNGRPLGFSQPYMMLMNVLPVNPMPPRLAPGTE